MSLDRPKPDRFSSDKRVADGSVRIMLDHCMANLEHLRKLRRGERYIEAVLSFDKIVREGDELAPGQRSFLEGIYEKSFAGAGYESVSAHIDRKKSLRYG